MQEVAVLKTLWRSVGQWLRLTDVRGRSETESVDLAQWAKPVGESTAMGSTSHSAAATVLSQEEEEVGYSPRTQVANTIDPFAYQLPDLLPRSHCSLLVNTEK